jgi:hypothetical protein
MKSNTGGTIYDYGKLVINGNNGISLISNNANDIKLGIQPSSDAGTTQPLAVATCGWVNNNAITIDKTTYTPVTATKKVVTDVKWTGTQLTYDSENWEFVNGVLVKVTTNTTTVIDTPVTYSGS